jgi:thiol-disulfide isomerase/thioredoxin
MQAVISTIVFLCAAFATAHEKPDVLTKAQEEFLALKKEFDAAKRRSFAERDEFQKQIKLAKDDAQRKALEKKLDEWQKRLQAEGTMTAFGPPLVDFAANHAKDVAGFNALELVLREEHSFGRLHRPLAQRAVDLLRRYYVEVSDIKRLLLLLGSSLDEASEKLVFEVLEKNPDRVTRARAAQVLARACERNAALAREFQTNKEMRKQAELDLGREFVEQFIVRGGKAPAQLKKLLTQIEETYSDLIPCVGKAAPDATCHDLAGKKVTLSDFRGKVVILDFWATWCLPCKAMIPHQRNLVDKLKGKPCVLVSVSIDEKRESLEEFLKNEAMPWTHWWAGNKSGIGVDWNISYVPAIYVLDARGVIRHRDHSGEFPAERLEAAVNALLTEIGSKDER